MTAIEKCLQRMRSDLATAKEMETRHMYELADAYGARAANHLANAVRQQYTVLDLGIAPHERIIL